MTPVTYLLFGSNPWFLPIAMAIALAIAVEAPVLFGKRLVNAMHVSDAAWNMIQGGVLTLVAFMLGISFSQSQMRFDARRQLVVTEANAIGTTWLRADQLPAHDATLFRSILTDYSETRLRAYRGGLTVDSRDEAQARSDADQAKLWTIASAALREQPQNLGRSLLMQTLNDVIDVSAEQLTALTQHVPTSIVTLTLALVIIGAILIGFGFARSGSNPSILAAAYLLASIIVISMMVDLDRPQKGFVRINLDPLVIQVRSMH